MDSTNILPPYTKGEQPYGALLSVITNIGLDHTEFLGNTLPEIAREKAGIIKPGVACVVGESHPETDAVFLSAAQTNGILGAGLETDHCMFWFADRCTYLNRERHRVVTSCELQGVYQEKNMQTAYVALRALMGMRHRLPACTLNNDTIRIGFANVVSLTGLRGRWEILQQHPFIVCDTGHNSHGLRHVATQLVQMVAERQSLLPKARLRIVFGMVDDKDVEQVIRLMPVYAKYYLTRAQTHRAIPSERLANLWKDIVPNVETEMYEDVPSAVAAARAEQRENDILFIGGSNYVVGEALRLFTAHGPADAE